MEYSPGILSLLPLYYVGWADSVLSPSEVRMIKQQVDALPFLSQAEKYKLNAWSNPSKPPSDELFKEWVAMLKAHADTLPEHQRHSFVELGLSMAKKSANGNAAMWAQAQTKQALESIEQALGVVRPETYSNIFAEAQPIEEEELPEAAPFEAVELTKVLEGDQFEFKQKGRLLLSDPLFQFEIFPKKEDYRERTLEWCKMLARQGWGGYGFPEAFGGNGDMNTYFSGFDLLAEHDLSLAIKFGVQFGLFGGSVYALGTEMHHRDVLSKIMTLELPGCFAMTETNHGSNVRGLETTATYLPETDEIEVHTPHSKAGKEYIGNALHGHMASVFAQLIVDGVNHGVHAILVPLRDESGALHPGVRFEDNGYKMGLNGVDNGRLWFTHVRVPRKNLLNRFGNIDDHGQYSSPIESDDRRFFTMLGTLVRGRVGVPRAGLGAAKKGLHIAIQYALKRRQFAPKVGQEETLLLDYPTHQRRLMPHLAKAYALHFGLRYLTEQYLESTEENIREIESLAAGMKAYTTWFTTKALQECRGACGGKGFLLENQIGRLKADTDIFTTFEGDNTVLMQLVAKGLLSAFRKSFHDEGFIAVMRFLADRVSTNITERNPYVIRRTDTEHLLDQEFHLAAFNFREKDLLSSCANRMRQLLGKRMAAYDVFTRVQTHMITLAEAYIERIILEQFYQKINSIEQPDVKATLERLAQLYALHTIESHKGYYLEQNYLDGLKSKAIRRVVNRLCREVRQDAGLLTDAWGIPPHSVAAEILN